MCDAKGLGYDPARRMDEIGLRGFERGEVLARMRVIADTQAAVEAERMEERKAQNEGGRS